MFVVLELGGDEPLEELPMEPGVAQGRFPALGRELPALLAGRRVEGVGDGG